MKLPRRQFLHLAAGAAALPLAPHVAMAQIYPTRPITIVIGYAAGGPTDTRVRILAQHMRATLATHHKAEIEKWWPILRAANVKGE